MKMEYTVLAVVTGSLVRIAIRSKSDDSLLGRPRYMSQDEANRLKMQWDFHHMDGDYYCAIE